MEGPVYASLFTIRPEPDLTRSLDAKLRATLSHLGKELVREGRERSEDQRQFLVVVSRLSAQLASSLDLIQRTKEQHWRAYDAAPRLHVTPRKVLEPSTTSSASVDTQRAHIPKLNMAVVHGLPSTHGPVLVPGKDIAREDIDPDTRRWEVLSGCTVPEIVGGHRDPPKAAAPSPQFSDTFAFLNPLGLLDPFISLFESNRKPAQSDAGYPAASQYFDRQARQKENSRDLVW